MSNTFWWIILILLLIFGVYMAFVIRKEKDVALDNAIPLVFNGLEIPIPPWWTVTKNEDRYLQFERTDTRYEWQSRFTFKETGHGKDLQDVFEKLAKKKELVFDKDTSIIHEPHSFVHLQEQGLEILRVEGTATKEGEHRVYYDAAIVRVESGYVILESESSVLNGLLEGPFFEQALHHIKKSKK